MPDVSSITNIDAKRPMLYSFAHKWLPSLVHKMPRDIRATIEQDGAKFIDAAWNAALSVAKQASDLPKPTLVARRVVGDRAWFVLAMPQPLVATEVFFIGLGLTEVDASYVTLELGYDVARQAGALVLCSWTSGGAHANWGEIEIAIEPEPFLDTCIAWQAR
jgi:hypothetical protein